MRGVPIIPNYNNLYDRVYSIEYYMKYLKFICVKRHYIAVLHIHTIYL